MSSNGAAAEQRGTTRGVGVTEPSSLPPVLECAERLAEHRITHRRSGYRDPESQAFIESWFGKLKERLVWRSEFETLDSARAEIAAYIDSYHHRPHSGSATEHRRRCARPGRMDSD
jgi:hypothetical protein